MELQGRQAFLRNQMQLDQFSSQSMSDLTDSFSGKVAKPQVSSIVMSLGLLFLVETSSAVLLSWRISISQSPLQTEPHPISWQHPNAVMESCESLPAADWLWSVQSDPQSFPRVKAWRPGIFLDVYWCPCGWILVGARVRLTLSHYLDYARVPLCDLAIEGSNVIFHL